jgi:hypothetical protein
VWLGRDKNAKGNQQYTLNNIVMIKYYKGMAIAVTARIKNGELTLKSWYDVRSKDVRRGLLQNRIIRKNRLNEGD